MADRRIEVLRAAVRVFSEKGYRGATMADISSRVGVTKPALYYYVRTKEELLVRVYEYVLAQRLAREEAALAMNRSPEETIRLILVSGILYGCEHAALYRIFFEEEAELPADLMQTVSERRRAREDVLATLVAKGAADGSFRLALSPRLAARTMLGTVNLVYKWYRPDGPKTAEQIATEVVEYLVASLRGGGLPAADDGARSPGRTARTASRRGAGSRGPSRTPTPG